MKSSAFKRVLTCAMALLMTLTAFAVIAPAASAADPVIITLDPGHGPNGIGCGKTGADSATAFGGVNEYIYTLQISLYCRERLQSYSGVTVYMTRYDHTTNPELSERTTIAQNHNSDALISIHNNSASASAKGAEIIVPNNNWRPAIGQASTACANIILNEMVAQTGVSKRKVYTRDSTSGTYADGSAADYYSIINGGKKKNIPVVMIVETAFLSNYDDYINHFSSEDKLKAMGYAIADGIAKYYNLTLDPNAPPPATGPSTPPVTSMMVKISNDEQRLRGKVGNLISQSFGQNEYDTWNQTVDLDKDRVYDIADIGWAAFNSSSYTYGYIINGVEYFDQKFTIKPNATVSDAITASGASNGSNFMGLLDTDWLKVGRNSVKFCVKLDGGKVETIRQYTVNATGTETVTDPVTEPVTEPVTDPVTEPVTEPVTTEAVTTAPVDTEPTTEPTTPSLAGCGATVSGVAGLIALITAGGALLCLKKKD